MSRLRVLSGLVLALLAMTASSSADEEVSLDDFAWHAPIHTADDGPLHELALPLALYRAATHSGLGDVRVFNATGDVVPHGLLPRPLDGPPAEPPRVSVPAFPFAELAARRGGDLDVRVHSDGERTSVTVRSGDQGVLEGSWVVDTGRLEARPRALLLHWPAVSAPLTRRVRLEGSRDLSRWYGLGGPLTIADVSWAGERLLANRVELPTQRYRWYRWYRIESVDGGGPLPTLTVEAELAPRGEPATQREWLTVAVRPLDEPAGALGFDTPAALPVERVRVTPAERNTFLRLRVEARGDDGDWRPAGRGNAYRLDFDNGSINGPPIAVGAPAAVAWRLLADDDAGGGGFGRLPPTVEVGWTPRSLVFLARGEGPYTLAFGSRRAQPVLADGRRLLGDSVDIVDLPPATVGTAVAGADPESALATRVQVDWKQLLLWAVLVAGVALLALLAYRLLRQPARD